MFKKLFFVFSFITAIASNATPDKELSKEIDENNPIIEYHRITSELKKIRTTIECSSSAFNVPIKRLGLRYNQLRNRRNHLEQEMSQDNI
ncbi:hypothetical protein A3F06_00780 [candidate division TM6 bacterium RIFCSPHIGHO2_12_FULL_36_22]|nr:MAG: hypothetical protein A3F06_00780 [candidate division TM6 bacterium RIFCSPHIGHO2_12_FULL_36_22]